MVERHVRVFLVHVGDDVFPELEGFQHVRLVHAGQALVALLRSLESHVGDAADFAFRIAHGVEAFALALERTVRALAHAAGLAEINVARQFADDQNIQAGHHFRLQGRGARQFRIQNGRTQVGEQAQVLAQAQDRLFRTELALQVVIFVVADGAEQHGIGRFR
ncbi:hypothetical protein D3C85_354520 [compost metagenome]